MRRKSNTNRQVSGHSVSTRLSVRLGIRVGLLAGALGVSLFSASLMASEAGVIRSFEGQIMRCATRADLGRMAYTVKAIKASVRPPNLEIEADVQTLKCRERAGVMRFEPSALGGRVANRNGGFIEFTGIELVGYTPDLRVFRSQPLDLKSSGHRVKFLAPAGGFAGLLPRNLETNGDRQVVFMTMLRGQANLGELATGQVFERSQESLGTFGFRMTESAGQLVIRRTPMLTSALTSATRP